MFSVPGNQEFNRGLERTVKEYETLLGRAGFRVTGVLPTASPFSLVEAKPA